MNSHIDPRARMWDDMNRPAPESVTVAGIRVRQGSRVRLKPRSGGDVFDLALAGKIAVVEGIEQDFENQLHFTVTLEDDPGRALGEERYLGHRFFFSASEIEPFKDAATEASAPGLGILVAGIGNIFLGDDGFGVEVAQRLAQRPLPSGVKVVDFGIRGMDLVYALGAGYDAAILVDAVPRGEAPGTLYVIEPEVPEDQPVVLDTHGMDPAKVLRLAQTMGGVPPRTLVVGCEPQTVFGGESYEDVLVQLSEPVRAAVDEAVKLVESLIEELNASTDDTFSS